jgi:hypothetical protein
VGLERRPSPWLFGRTTDLITFGLVPFAAIALALLAPSLGLVDATKAWAFLIFIVGVDVAHVYSTVFRSYLDREEVRARGRLFMIVPMACFGTALIVHAISSALFWTALAYLALFHFIRQQVGFGAIYRARGGEARTDKLLDDAALYAATLGPVVYWHTHLPRAFSWFQEGDFIGGAHPEIGVAALMIEVLILAGYFIRAVSRVLEGRPNFGRDILVLTTALTWFVGIVATNSDFQFTVTNVLPHGVAYAVLTYRYARERQDELRPSFYSGVIGFGVGGFFALLLGLAFAEEFLWDRLVWHTHPELFGISGIVELPPMALTIAIAILVTPQATHYVLDAFLWRTRDKSDALGRALGFLPAQATAASPSVVASSP